MCYTILNYHLTDAEVGLTLCTAKNFYLTFCLLVIMSSVILSWLVKAVMILITILREKTKLH